MPPNAGGKSGARTRTRVPFNASRENGRARVREPAPARARASNRAFPPRVRGRAGSAPLARTSLPRKGRLPRFDSTELQPGRRWNSESDLWAVGNALREKLGEHFAKQPLAPAIAVDAARNRKSEFGEATVKIGRPNLER